MPTQNILEYAKTMEDQKARAIVELFPEAVDFFGVMPFMTVPGGVYRYMEEGALPNNVAFRALNEEPTNGYGLLVDRVEQTYPMAGNIDVDRRKIARDGGDRRAIDERLQIKAFGKKWADTWINGNNVTTPREWTGIKTRLAAVGGSTDGTNYLSRILANSASSGGGALSLAQLDRAIGLVENPNAIIMPKALADRFPAAVRDSAVGGVYTNDTEDMGRRVARYQGLPIYTGYGVTRHGEFLPFNEVGAGGGSAVTSSIYIVRFSEDGVCGLQQQPMEVTDMGLLNNGVHYRTNVEYDVGMAIFDPFSAIRLSSITNAAIVK